MTFVPGTHLRQISGPRLDALERMYGTGRREGERCLVLRHRMIAIWIEADEATRGLMRHCAKEGITYGVDAAKA